MIEEILLDELIRQKGGIKLDIACGASKDAGWFGMDIQALPGVDLVWDLNVHPWPLPDECVLIAKASHVLEHIPKVAFDGTRTRFLLLEFMNEMWRVMKMDGQFAIAVPHWHSEGFAQDPTHTAEFNERTWAYFDPRHPFYQFYRPLPWQVIDPIYWDPTINMELVLKKIPVPEVQPEFVQEVPNV